MYQLTKTLIVIKHTQMRIVGVLGIIYMDIRLFFILEQVHPTVY